LFLNGNKVLKFLGKLTLLDVSRSPSCLWFLFLKNAASTFHICSLSAPCRQVFKNKNHRQLPNF